LLVNNPDPEDGRSILDHLSFDITSEMMGREEYVLGWLEVLVVEMAKEDAVMLANMVIVRSKWQWWDGFIRRVCVPRATQQRYASLLQKYEDLLRKLDGAQTASD